MLRSLHIENAAVIKSVDIDFDGGFAVMSGETGAGKSIIVDSINMISGNRVSREMIRSGEDKLVVSAVFTDCGPDVENLLENYEINCDGSVILQKCITRDGKQTCKLNGRTITQSLQKELAALLINIHGQNDNQRLMQRSAQAEILDAYADCKELVSDYSEVYKRYLDATARLDSFNSDELQKVRMHDMLKYQLEEINSAKLKIGEEEKLEAERDRLANIEKIAHSISVAYHALYTSEKGAVTLQLERAAAALEKISGFVPEASEFAKQLIGYRYDIEDIAATVRGYAENVDGDPTERLNKIESRLNMITKLKRKYGADIAEILRFRDEAAVRLDEIENSDEIRKNIELECAELKKEAEQLAQRIHEKRIAASGKIENEVKKTLEFLDMPKVRFVISINRSEKLRSNGADEISFMIAVNAGEALMPLEKTASGGELSRVMLALRSVLSDKDGVGTVIFDEVDSGISGKTSRKVGIKLKETAKSTQVICVTHSAQIASLADQHFLISKNEIDGRTETRVDELDEKGRVAEVARILGGINITDVQRAAAVEMIEEGKSY